MNDDQEIEKLDEFDYFYNATKSSTSSTSLNSSNTSNSNNNNRNELVKNYSSNLSINKRPQVYSSYIQPEFKISNDYRSKSNFNKYSTSSNTNSNNNRNQIKRPKLNENNADLYHSRKKSDSINDEPQMEINYPNDKSINDSTDLLIRSFLGLNTFKHENIFMDLIEQDFILISLDKSTKSKINNFSFKGKCSMALVYGFLQINGFNLKRNFGTNSQYEGSNEPTKWFDLYSPETNSFISILNRLEENQDLFNTNLSFEHQQNYLINQIKSSIYYDSSLNQQNLDSIETNLRSFLNDFSPNSTSLFLIRGLKSQMCSYLSYFENFQQVYQSYTNGSSHHSISNKKRDKKVTAFRPQLNEIDSKFARLGLYALDEQSFNSIHIENDEDKSICDEILKLNTAPTNSADNKPDSENVDLRSPVVMACGGKDVGKSTFLRYMINSFLNRYPKVAYMDCDPGQCEFTLGGCITLSLITEPLLGPPHTHISHSSASNSCYFLGHISAGDAPGHYLQCLRQCSEDFLNYKSTLNQNEIVPLIVNTMGWNQGLGLCLLKETILLFKPTHVVQINHPIEANKNMPTLDKAWLIGADGWPSVIKPVNSKNLLKQDESNSSINKSLNESNSNQNMDSINKKNDSSSTNLSNIYDEISYKLLILKSCSPYKTRKFQSNPAQKRFSPKDHRNISIISYFSKLQDPKLYFKPIHQIKPYRVSWSKFAMHISHSRVEYEQFFRVFNASIVGLCQVDPKFIHKKQEYPDLPGYLQTYDEEKSVPVLSKCIGFGIIRGINMESKEFYILTPEPIESLENVNLLVKGILNLPLEFFYEQDSETSCPYMSFSDNLQKQSNDLNMSVGNEPFQRKYLIHQQQQQPNQNQNAINLKVTN